METTPNSKHSIADMWQTPIQWVRKILDWLLMEPSPQTSLMVLQITGKHMLIIYL